LFSGYNWCDVSWVGERGWVSGAYLAHGSTRYARRPIPSIGPSIGLPVIGISPEVYHRQHYARRAWYRDRYLGRHERPFDGRDHGDVRREPVRRESGTDPFTSLRRIEVLYVC
jgi:uncharacterized protein YraI